MQAAILLALAFVVACWVLVVGHQLEWGILADPDQYVPVRVSMFIAYIGAAMSACAIAAVAVGMLKK